MTRDRERGMMSRGGTVRRFAVPLLFIASQAVPADALAAGDTTWGMYCRRNAGFAGGVVSAPGTWERIGKSSTFATASPVLGAACALDVGPMSVAVGTEAAFTYVHYDQNKSLSTGWLTFYAAVTGGTDEIRAGAHIEGVFKPVGAGLTFDWLPGDPHGSRDGLEVRLTEYWLGKPNTQLMVLYTVATPRIP